MIEDFALLDILLSDSFPKELNNSKIKDIVEILQNQERPDLVQEMKNLLLLKTIGKNSSWEESNKYSWSWFSFDQQSLTDRNVEESSGTLRLQKSLLC